MSTSQCRRLAGGGDVAEKYSVARPPDLKAFIAVTLVQGYGSLVAIDYGDHGFEALDFD